MAVTHLQPFLQMSPETSSLRNCPSWANDAGRTALKSGPKSLLLACACHIYPLHRGDTNAGWRLPTLTDIDSPNESETFWLRNSVDQPKTSSREFVSDSPSNVHCVTLWEDRGRLSIASCRVSHCAVKRRQFFGILLASCTSISKQPLHTSGLLHSQ